MSGQKELLTVGEAEDVLGVSRWKIYELIRTGQLPVLHIGRLVRIPRPVLYQWIEANTRRTGEAA